MNQVNVPLPISRCRYHPYWQCIPAPQSWRVRGSSQPDYIFRPAESPGWCGWDYLNQCIHHSATSTWYLLVWILIEMIDAICIDQWRSTFNAVHCISFASSNSARYAPSLHRNARDERCFWHVILFSDQSNWLLRLLIILLLIKPCHKNYSPLSSVNTHNFIDISYSLMAYNGKLVSQSCFRKSDIEVRIVIFGLNFSE